MIKKNIISFYAIIPKINFIFQLFFFLYFTTVYAGSDKISEAKNGMVVSASGLASQVGADILYQGGNAVDAAVAVGFALAVTFPEAGNIGGGGFMVIHLASGKNTSIDYREKAPIKSTKDMYLDKNGNYISDLSKDGIMSVGVPGSVAGMIYALEKYGTMKLSQVIQPAINLAENGFTLDNYTANGIKGNLNSFKKYPSSIKIFSKNGEAFQKSEIFKQSDLAGTLKEIKEKGRDGFYKGKIAELIAQQAKAMTGIISLEDLEKYQPVERITINGTYRGYEIISMPPPSSGGIALVQLLNILENYNFSNENWGSSNYIHKIISAEKFVYADRSIHLGDPDFYTVPKQWLTSKNYAKEIFEKINLSNGKAIPSKEISAGKPITTKESNETTHYSVSDKFGNAVSVTTTLNSSYGSNVVVEGAGFLLNNEMDDFSAKENTPNQFGLLGGTANSIQPEKRMLSSMTPTIVLKDGKTVMVIGSPGGSTIITTVLQVILNVIDFGMNIQEAVDTARFHHQWYPDEIFYEKQLMTSETKNNLTKMGYTLGKETPLGRAEGIFIDTKNNVVYGASDVRGNGKAVGH